MPPWIIGYFILNKRETLFIQMRLLWFVDAKIGISRLLNAMVFGQF